jgi:hypothetical protein
LSQRSSRSGYMDFSRTEWVVKSDGSVDNGSEVVSPPLDFHDPDQRAQVTRAIEAVRAIGCRPHSSAGIHVHVDVSDLTPKQLGAVVKMFYRWQDVIYRIASSGSTTIRSSAFTYARTISRERAELMGRATTPEELRAGWNGRRYNAVRGEYIPDHGENHGDGSRYCGINMVSYWYRGTIEFRVFNSSMNPERVQAYIAMCVALVEDARSGKSRSITNALEVGTMRLKRDTSSPEEFRTYEDRVWHRFIQILRYDAGMAREDMRALTACWRDSHPQAPVGAAHT